MIPLPTNSIRARLLFGMVMMLFPFALLALSAFNFFNELLRSVDEIHIETTSEIVPLARLQRLIPLSLSPLNHYIVSPDGPWQSEYSQINREIEQAFTSARKSEISRAELNALDLVEKEWLMSRAAADQFVQSDLAPTSNERHELAARQSLTRVDHHLRNASRHLNETIAIAIDESDGHVQSAHGRLKSFAYLTLAIAGIGVVIAITLALLISRTLIAPLAELSQGTDHFANGRLGYRIRVERKDEIGHLADAFNKMASRIERLTDEDPLTGIYNRRAFNIKLHEEVARGLRHHHPVSLLMIDIDHFKSVNDTHGHQVGDQVLQQVADRLLGQIREFDFAFRYGGEELGLLLPETSIGEAAILADRTLTAISARPFITSSAPPINLTVSIGMASLPDHAHDERSLVAAADSALYRAKRNGRNRIESAEIAG